MLYLTKVLTKSFVFHEMQHRSISKGEFPEALLRENERINEIICEKTTWVRNQRFSQPKCK